jgi:hypothetical protein
VFPALLTAATLPERRDDARRLAERGPAWLGFKQVVSVQRPPVEVKPWRDSALTPTFNHGGHAGTFAGGVFGFGGPYASYGPMLAYDVLGVPYGRRSHRPRADVTRRSTTPARQCGSSPAPMSPPSTGNWTLRSFTDAVHGHRALSRPRHGADLPARARRRPVAAGRA